MACGACSGWLGRRGPRGQTGDVAGARSVGVWQPSGDSLGKRREQSSVSHSVPGGRGSGQSGAGPRLVCLETGRPLVTFTGGVVRLEAGGCREGS